MSVSLDEIQQKETSASLPPSRAVDRSNPAVAATESLSELSISAEEHDDGEAGTFVDQRHRYTDPAPVAAAGARPEMDVLSAGSSGQKVGVASLDVLFYIIIGVASLSLFGSVYVLLTQNDAFIEREYALLQKESNALDARLKALTRSNNPLPANTATMVAAPADATDDTASSIINSATTEPAATAVAVTSTTVAQSAGAAVDEAAVQPVSPEVPVAARQAVDLISLQNELAALKSELAVQGGQLLQLIDENKALRQATQKPADPQTPGTSAVVTLKEISANRIDSVQAPVADSPVVTAAKNPAVEDSNLIQQAYRAYQASDYEYAGRLYNRALQLDPYDRDANLGVAASARQLGDLSVAEDRYRHLLSLDPQDPTAFSALLNLRSLSNEVESDLTLHAQRAFRAQPALAAPLYAALGNYYSRTSRWSDSRWAYTRALAGAGGEADYLYNLAVVLDNMGEYRQAIQHYARAISATATSSYSFDDTQAQIRLNALQAR